MTSALLELCDVNFCSKFSSTEAENEFVFSFFFTFDVMSDCVDYCPFFGPRNAVSGSSIYLLEPSSASNLTYGVELT